MTHQPYIDWILADTARPDKLLNETEQADLQKHLSECQECGRYFEAWCAVEEELRTTPLVAPKTGFTIRWQTHLEADRQHQHRWQAIEIFAASLGLALALFALLVILTWPLLRSPQLLAWTLLYQIVRWVSLLSTVQQFSASLLRAASRAVSPITWMVVIGVLALLAGIWLAAYRALTIPRKISTWSEPK